MFYLPCNAHRACVLYNLTGNYKYLYLKTGFIRMASCHNKRLIAVCQMTATNSKQENIKTCSKLIQSAKDQNCSVVFLPEACDYIGESKAETLSMAEPLDGDSIKAFCKMAKESEIWVSLGGFHEKISGEKVQNSHILIDSNGSIASVYRKTHLFDVDLPEQGIRLMESEYVVPGENVVEPCETPVGRLALSVCYDIRFPELSLMLSRMEADILTFPSAFTYVTGAGHWETMLKARAIENQCYVVAAAQTGSHNKKRTSWGHAMVVDPWGVVVAQCTEGTGIATAEINLEYIREVRASIPVQVHRRCDVYHAMVPNKQDDSNGFEFRGQCLQESIIFRTKYSLAFMSSNPIVLGHVLVVPQRQVSRLGDLNSDETTDLFLLVRRVQKTFETCYGVTANTMFMKEGLDYLVVHLLPRRVGDFKQNDEIYLHLENHAETSKYSKEILKDAYMLQACLKEET